MRLVVSRLVAVVLQPTCGEDDLKLIQSQSATVHMWQKQQSGRQ